MDPITYPELVFHKRMTVPRLRAFLNSFLHEAWTCYRDGQSVRRMRGSGVYMLSPPNGGMYVVDQGVRGDPVLQEGWCYVYALHQMPDLDLDLTAASGACGVDYTLHNPGDRCFAWARLFTKGSRSGLVARLYDHIMGIDQVIPLERKVI